MLRLSTATDAPDATALRQQMLILLNTVEQSQLILNLSLNLKLILNLILIVSLCLCLVNQANASFDKQSQAKPSKSS